MNYPISQNIQEWLEDCKNCLELKKNPTKADAMESYLRGQFKFYGISIPVLREITKDLIISSKQYSVNDIISLIFLLFEQEQRDFLYCGINLMIYHVDRFEFADILVLIELIDKKSWWDSIDRLRKPIAMFCDREPEYYSKLVKLFLKSDSMWQQRMAIILQLMRKENTDFELLKTAIFQKKEDNRFFIQKAIGWALRQYAWTNPKLVKEFVNQNEFSNLVRRESLKNL